MSTAERMLVTCPHCETETRLSDLDGDTCPGCNRTIPDDAPTKVPTDVVDGRWHLVLDGEPMGGTDYSADEIAEPERHVAEITATLISAEEGDHVRVTIGVAGDTTTTTLYVANHERNVAGFEHRLSLCPRPREDGWTRLYMTGIGSDGLDPWEVVSAPYDLGGDGTLDARDYAANGWVVAATTVDEPVDRVDRGGE